jgi:hypothetical protein
MHNGAVDEARGIGAARKDDRSEDKNLTHVEARSITGMVARVPPMSP